MTDFPQIEQETQQEHVVWILHDSQRPAGPTTAALLAEAGLLYERAFEEVGSLCDALAAEASARPDVVLLDLHLPSRSGLAVLPKICAKVPSTAVVVLATSEEESLVFEAFKAGASGFLSRGADPEDVRAAVRQAGRGGVVMPRSVVQRVWSFFQKKPEASPDRYGLTQREREVLKLMTQGLSQREIAEEVMRSPHTINTHVQRIYAKLHVHSATEAVAKAVRERLV